MAVAKLLILCGGILAVPFCGQVIVHWLSVDSLKSSTDTLTGLPNRRGFFRSAQTLLRHADYRSRPYFTIAMIDLDGFKRLNDTLGHPTGDRVLVAVADSLRDVSGTNTAIARVGGEEFLFAHCPLRSRPGRAPKNCARGHRCRAVGRDRQFGFGVDGDPRARAETARSDRMLIARADAAMYEAKRSGGNQIRYAGDLTGDGSEAH